MNKEKTIQSEDLDLKVDELETELSSNEKVPAKLTGNYDFYKKKNIPSIAFLTLISTLIFVMWCGGFNFLPLIAIVFASISGLILLIQVIKTSTLNVYMIASYIVAISGTFIYFLIWSAEPFSTALWWNLVLSMFPIMLSIFLIFIKKFVPKKYLKFSIIATAILMIITSLVYFMFANLRAIPTVERLWTGHDAYLNSLKDNPTPDDSPNVLYILMDDLGFGDISSYSYLQKDNKTPTINTPNIDSIAENGIMMDNFYASSPVCSPSRFSSLTGRYSSRGYLDNVIFPSDIRSNPYAETHFLNPYQFLHNVDGLLGDEITFAEALQSIDYNTACIGKWNLGDYGEYLPTNQGFDYFYGSHYVNDMTPHNWVREENGKFEEVKTHNEIIDQSESTRYFTNEVKQFISKSAQNDEKFLTFYTSPWPHYPIYSGEKYNTSDDSYIDCVEEFDAGIGEIIQTLKDEGVYEDTLIIFTSDNGPGREGSAGAHRGRKNTTFEGGVKVPLLAQYINSDIAKGSVNTNEWEFTITNEIGESRKATTTRIETSSMIFDLFPTILDYCGINTLPNDRIIDGKSLRDLWECNEATDYRLHDKLFYQKKGKVEAIQMPMTINGEIFDFKYFKNVATENSAFINQRYKNYLFNLDTDPIEGYNISMKHPSIANTLANELEKFKQEMKTNRRGIL